LFVLAAAMLAACDFTSGSNDSDDPLDQPEFQTPVAEAQAAGVEVWWLGEQFEFESNTLRIGGTAHVIDREEVEGVSLQLQYLPVEESDAGSLIVISYESGSSEAAVVLTEALSVPGAASQEVDIRGMHGELVTLPAGNRPVNQLWLFVDTGSAEVLIRAPSGTTGVPGTDSNPLIDEDLLVELASRELRAYPS
jgi:hypothetical protein